ncbi:MAG: FmdB family zinc ribbon protein [Candidatus Rokuibacteriota bacterium]
MLTYEYECDTCGRVFEVRQRISEAPLTACDACGGAVHRLLSPAPFILKGEGWYVTDYPSESRKKAREAEKKSDSPTPAAPASSSSTTPASSDHPKTPSSPPKPKPSD